MQDKILKIAKRLKQFTIDDLIMFSDIDEQIILETLIKSGSITQFGSYFEYTEQIQKPEQFKIVDKHVECKNSDITVVDAVNTYLKLCDSKKLSIKTVLAYRTFSNAHIIPYFKKMLLKNIAIQDISAFKNFMQKKNVSERRIRNILCFLNQIIKYFQNEGYVEKNCIFEVKRLAKIPKRKIQILTNDEIEKLFEITNSKYPYLTQIIQKVITLKQPLNSFLTGNEQEKNRIKRKIRKDFYKIKQKLGLEKFMFDDLRYCNIDN